MSVVHPAVIKAKRLGRIAFENGWKGSLDHDPATSTTELSAERNDEHIYVKWIDNTMDKAEYYILGKRVQLSCAKDVVKILRGWPDIIVLMKLARALNISGPDIVETYRRLPFDWENDSNEDIMAAMVERTVYWYNRIDGRVESDFVTKPRRKSQIFEVKPVGHRKIFNFIGTQCGMRTVILDMVLKVE